jgi:hypothetical protein
MAQQIFVDDKALAPSSLVAGCKKRATQVIGQKIQPDWKGYL